MQQSTSFLLALAPFFLYLFLSGGLLSLWKKHWCVLRDDTFMWFRGKQVRLNFSCEVCSLQSRTEIITVVLFRCKNCQTRLRCFHDKFCELRIFMTQSFRSRNLETPGSCPARTTRRISFRYSLVQLLGCACTQLTGLSPASCHEFEFEFELKSDWNKEKIQPQTLNREP